jgi:transcriptional antiterminator NusG
MEQQSKKWYVVRAISGKEKKAKEYIESEMAKRGWAEDVPQVLVPTEKIYTIRNGKKVVKDRNYFPGYVLIEADLRDEIIPVIQNLPNVLDFLRESGGGKPIPMRQAEVNRILGKMDDQQDAIDGNSEAYMVGEVVKVIDGPFSSFAGVVEEVNDEKKKLKVTVKIFGRKTPLELSYNQVEKE